VRLAGLDHTPHAEELPPVLAARSLLGAAVGACANNYGSPPILTWITAALFRLGGESLVLARLPAVFGGCLLVLAVHRWTRAAGGRTAGCVAGGLLALNPLAVAWSQAVHGAIWTALATWLGAIAAFRLALALARARDAVAARRNEFAGLALMALAALGGLLLARVWPAFAPGRPEMRVHGGDFAFYHRILGADHAALWPLLPLAWLLALPAAPRPLALLGLFFAAWFTGLSLAPAKEERFLLHVLPFFAAIAGAAAAVLLPRARAALADVLAAGPSGPRRLERGIATLLLAVALWPLVASTGAFALTWRMVVGRDAEWKDRRAYRGEADWRGAAVELAAVADSAGVLVVSNGLQGLYAFGRADYELSVRALRSDAGTAPEFSPSRRSGVPAISTPEAVARVMEAAPRGLLVIAQKDWHAGWGVPPGTANLVTAYADPVPLPSAYRILAYRWRPLAE
jgi:hypothetical protein